MDVSDADRRGAPLRRHRTTTAVSAGAPVIGSTPSPAPRTPVVPAPFAGTPRQLAAANYAAFKPTAEKLASQVAPGLVPFTPPGPGLSTKARWFSDSADGLLVVVVENHDGPDVSDEILAYALAWQCDRDLALVLPQTHVGLTHERLPWIETPVRVFTYSDDLTLRPMVVPSRTEILALAASRPLRSTEIHDLKRRDVLVEQLVRRLDNHWALVRAHRPGYLAWHCLGRQVITITRRVKNVTIVAGVAYGDPPAGETKALVVPVDKQLLPLELAAIERRVSDAIWKRYAGHDRGHHEHRMQAALASTGLTKLDIQPGHLNREYPAWRGEGRPGFIDFLALDAKNILHVIETKVGTADVKGVLQTLDYATWVTAHAAEIRVERGWGPASRPGRETVMMDFILAPKSPGAAAVGPYLAGQLEALSGGTPWRIWIVEDALADVPDPLVFERRTMPPPGPLVAKAVQALRWVARVGEGLRGDRPLALHASPEEALLPQARLVFADLKARGLVHRWAMHRRSSQAFALNLFAPLDDHHRRAALAFVGLDASSAVTIDFEYSDPGDRLGETGPKSQHRTQVDVVLRGTSAEGERIVALIEVKFTETDFGHCSAHENPLNQRRDVCCSPGLFGGQPEACFQLVDHGNGRRTYHDHLAGIPVHQPSVARDSGGCLVRESLSQPMRSLALAHLLLEAKEADRVAYVLCAPAKHPTIWRRFAELQAAFPDVGGRAIRALTAEQVAALHPDGGASMAALYPFGELQWAEPRQGTAPPIREPTTDVSLSSTRVP